MRVELRRDLNNVVAQMVRPKVNELAQAVAKEARTRAPAVRVWVTSEDERVRPSHVDADGQTIPANLRFKLKKQVYFRGGGRGSKVGGHTALNANAFDLAREPRDEDLPHDQRDRCRCIDVEIPGVIARKVVVDPAIAEGARVHAQVSVRFERIVESEFGTSRDEAAHFMSGAVQAVASKVRGYKRR